MIISNHRSFPGCHETIIFYNYRCVLSGIVFVVSIGAADVVSVVVVVVGPGVPQEAAMIIIVPKTNNSFFIN